MQSSEVSNDHLMLRKTLEIYEKMGMPDIPEKTGKDLKVIEMDVERTYFDYGNANRMLLRKELYNMLIRMPLDYTQGMSDIAGVLVYFYVENERLQNDIATNDIGVCDSTKSDADDTCEDDTAFASDQDGTDESGLHNLGRYENITCLLQNETRHKMITSVYHILRSKYLPLISSNFSLYLSYNDVLISFINRDQPVVTVNESIKFMNYTLTWFSRMLKSRDDIFFIFRLIIESDLDMVFVLMLRFYKNKSIGDREAFTFDVKNMMYSFRERVCELRRRQFQVWKNTLGFFVVLMIVGLNLQFIFFNFFVDNHK